MRIWHTLGLGGIADSSTFLASAELFDPNSNSFTATGNLTAVRFYQNATLLTDGTVLLSGGNDSSGALTTAEIYDPAAGTFATTGNMLFPRVWHTSTLLNNGRVLVTGGGVGPYATAELYL